MKALRQLLGASGGAAAIEAAIVFPVLVYLSLAAVEFSMIMYTQVCMEGGAREAARYGITGYVVSGVPRATQIKNIVLKTMPGFVDASKVTVSQLTYKTFANIGQPEPYTDSNHNGRYDVGEPYTDVNGNGKWDEDMGASGAGGPSDVVVYTVSYVWNFQTAAPLDFIGLPVSKTLTARVVMRNEPFPAGQSWLPDWLTGIMRS